MAMKNWWVVANAARARILEENGQPGVYVLKAEYEHASSRLKGMALGSTAPGHGQGGGHGAGSGAYTPRGDVREREHDRFAQQLADRLNEGVAAGHCTGLVLVASNPFLGLLKSHLGVQAHKAILHALPNDFTAFPEDELAAAAGRDCIALRLPTCRSGIAAIRERKSTTRPREITSRELCFDAPQGALFIGA
jgi:protein required for attachment to host cells